MPAPMLANHLSRGIVLTLSAEPLELPAAPLRFLLRLRQLAGHSRRLVTFTKSLATLFGVSTNTIRNWRNVLEDDGYIHTWTDQRTGQSTYLITEKVEPPSRRARLAEERRLDVRTPDPKPWWKFPVPRGIPTPGRGISMKSSFCVGGAKPFAPIKPSTRNCL